jgi:hypothetical protein
MKREKRREERMELVKKIFCGVFENRPHFSKTNICIFVISRKTT